MSEPKSITKYTENIIDILNYLIENAVPKTSKQLEVKFIKFKRIFSFSKKLKLK